MEALLSPWSAACASFAVIFDGSKEEGGYVGRLRVVDVDGCCVCAVGGWWWLAGGDSSLLVVVVVMDGMSPSCVNI